MIQCGSGLGFLLEAAKTLGIARPVFGKYLDGDVALQGGVAGAIDLAHPAGAKGTENFITIQPHAWGQRHR